MQRCKAVYSRSGAHTATRLGKVNVTGCHTGYHTFNHRLLPMLPFQKPERLLQQSELLERIFFRVHRGLAFYLVAQTASFLSCLDRKSPHSISAARTVPQISDI